MSLPGFVAKCTSPCLNESPSEKEGKFKAGALNRLKHRLNESPSEKEGKLNRQALRHLLTSGLNESPSEKEGKCPLR